MQAKEQAQVRQVEVAAKRKEKSLKRQLDSGFISQEEYETGIQKLNDETEKKKEQEEKLKKEQEERELKLKKLIEKKFKELTDEELQEYETKFKALP